MAEVVALDGKLSRGVAREAQTTQVEVTILGEAQPDSCVLVLRAAASSRTMI